MDALIALVVILCIIGGVGIVCWLHSHNPTPTYHVMEVRIPAIWNDYDWDGVAFEREGKAIFRLGEGPCGRNVTRLIGVWHGGNTFMVEQRHDDGSYKRFYYRREDITGRVEIEYALDTPLA